MRDDPLVGPAAIPPSQSIPGETDPAADILKPLLAGHLILPHSKCIAISQRGGGASRKHGSEQDEGADMRAIGYEVA
jgi:hypothetical protein